MSIRELTIDEFNAFVRNSPLGTHYQTFNYALLMGENGYEYELVGMFNEYNQLKAASLILFKNFANSTSTNSTSTFTDRELSTYFNCNWVN